jgi:type IV pilus assembly protein PilM
LLEQLKNMAFLPSFGKKTSTLLGVDISSTAVKILQLAATGDSYRLEDYVIRPLPANSVVEKNINDLDAVAESIASAVSLMKPSQTDAAVAVAGSAVITKTIEMNASLSDSEMENQIVVEADQYIPYPLDEVSIDFERQVVSERNPELVEVLLAACRRENVDTRVTALEVGGLTAKVVDIEAYAVERAFTLLSGQIGAEEDHTVAIVDIGSMMTTLNVVLQGRTIYTREQTFGGNVLSEDVQRRFGLSAIEAEQAMKRGELPEEYEQEILAPFKETVVQQVSQTLQFFFSSSHYNEVDHILLAGGVAVIDGLAELVQDSLSTPATVANPFEGLQIGSKVNKEMLRNDAPALLIATGLAMRGEY